MDAEERKAMRQMVADLIGSAGCSCCRSERRWEAAQAKLAKALRVPKYSDGSGFNFAKFQTKD